MIYLEFVCQPLKPDPHEFEPIDAMRGDSFESVRDVLGLLSYLKSLSELGTPATSPITREDAGAFLDGTPESSPRDAPSTPQTRGGSHRLKDDSHVF